MESRAEFRRFIFESHIKIDHAFLIIIALTLPFSVNRVKCVSLVNESLTGHDKIS